MGSFLLTQESESHVDDLVYLMRTSDAWRGRVLDPSGIGYGAVGLAQDEDWPAIEAMVRDHEGERSVELLQFWRHKGADLLVVRSPEGRIEGFALELRLDRLTPKEAAADPGVAPAYRTVSRWGLPPDRAVICYRFWMAGDTYQALSPIQSRLTPIWAQKSWTTQLRTSTPLGEGFPASSSSGSTTMP